MFDSKVSSLPGGSFVLTKVSTTLVRVVQQPPAPWPLVSFFFHVWRGPVVEGKRGRRGTDKYHGRLNCLRRRFAFNFELSSDTRKFPRACWE